MRKIRPVFAAPELLGYRKSGAPIYKVRGASHDDPLEQIAKRQQEILELLESTSDDIDKNTRSEAKTPEALEARSTKATELQARWTDLQAEFEANEQRATEIKAGIDEVAQRQAKLTEQRARWNSIQVDSRVGSPEENYAIDLRSLNQPGAHKNLVKRAAKILDDEDISVHLRADQKEHVTALVRRKTQDTDGEALAAYMIATSNPHYRSAFQKAVSSLTPAFTPEEARAVNEVNMVKRAMAIGASATGGFAVPVVIDPTIIMTAQGTNNELLQRARVETITNDRWRGISSSGMSWKFDAEAAASTDNSPAIAKPEVPVYRADGFIPYSIEVGMDWPGFADEMSQMLGSGYDELLADKLTTGTGANLPTGLISRLVSQTSPDVSTPTAAAAVISTNDIYAMWGRLPNRHRRKTTTAWMSSTQVQSAIRQLGSLDPNFGIGIMQGPMPSLLGHEYPMNDYMSDVAVGTAAANLAVVGDFKGFLVAQRAGMNIEFVPMLFDVTNNRPTGQRGWFAWARVGSDVVDPTAFQLLQNKTS